MHLTISNHGCAAFILKVLGGERVLMDGDKEGDNRKKKMF